MATKLKNTGKLKGFFLSHGEKLGVLVFVGITGWLVYSSLGRESETRQPQELSQLVNQTRSKVENFTFEDAKKQADPPPPLAEEFQAAVNEAVDPDIYAISRRGFSRPEVPPTVLRKDPVLLPAQDLRGQGFTVLMAFIDESIARARELEQKRLDDLREKQRELDRNSADDNQGRGRGGRGGGESFGLRDDPNVRPVAGTVRRSGASVSGDELVKTQPCAIVTAKVPVADQVKIYEDVFENALGHDPGRDVPVYLGYFVERAEVRGDKVSEFKPVAVRNGLSGRPLPVVTADTIAAVTANWSEEMEELVDSRYFNPALTFPLPAMVGDDWGREVVHPDVPLAAETEAAEEDVEEESELEIGEDDMFGGAVETRRGSARGRQAPPRRGGGFSRGGARGGDLRGGRAPRRGGLRGGANRSGRSNAGGAVAYDVPHQMIRFVDLSVAQGRRYKYRFQLVLLDVNGRGQTSSNYLEKEVKQRVAQAKRTSVPIIRTAWSEPSSEVSIPLAGGVLLAGVQPPTTGEPTADLVVQSFDTDESGKAIQASIEQEKVRLGSVMNMVERDVEILIDQNRFLKKVERFNFRTGITLLDAAGGEKLNKNMNVPGKVLIMDATGRLVVRSEVKDRADVQEFRETYAEEDTSRGGGGGRGGGDYFEFDR